ncbi:ubiquinone biosynthesis monooxygenase ubiB [Vibrio ishigakensis]|uniref:Ubiquinone biosynthesis monooxygenase ubiB n=1 Tax=Vibrio ishigakensis TaxID=1481914 RepID=A0A0B8QCF2_9VIBR|nr:ubiquinone biosynthesis monooxygenase ubiB [Vibrio ishigakensis]
MINSVKERAPFWAEKLPELPELLYDNLKHGKQLTQKVDHLYHGYRQIKRQHATGQFLFGIGATFIVCSSILFVNNNLLISAGIGGLGALAWLMSWFTYRK